MSDRFQHGGPAFPVNEDQYRYGIGEFVETTKFDGMTLRDYFAAKALQGFCANPSVFASNGMTGWAIVNCTSDQLAEYCTTLADAMLKAREA
jgi:hypothetical protein